MALAVLAAARHVRGVRFRVHPAARDSDAGDGMLADEVVPSEIKSEHRPMVVKRLAVSVREPR